MSVNFSCDLSDPTTPLPHFWEHTVGSGHAPLGLRADWQAQLKKSHEELGFRHVRFHGLLSDDMGTLICQNEKFLYSFFNADQIFDFLLSIGMKPFVELSFMPLRAKPNIAAIYRKVSESYILNSVSKRVIINICCVSGVSKNSASMIQNLDVKHF